MKMRRVCVILAVWLLVWPLSVSAQLFDEPVSTEPGIMTVVKYDEGAIVFHFVVDKDYHITDLKNGFFSIELGGSQKGTGRFFSKSISRFFQV